MIMYRRKCFFLVFMSCLTALICAPFGPVWAQKSGVSPDALILPKGPGSLGGIGENVSANLNMGLMSYPINIKIPPGRGQATPSVGVSYSSSAGAGIMGIGWNLNAGGAVRRLTVRGLPQYTDTDRFYAGGELIPITGTPYHRPRMEGSFVRYRWVQTGTDAQKGYWIAQYPDGSKGYYGANAKGELDLDAQVYGLKGTYRWELVTFVDKNGNRVEYTYFKEGSYAYLDGISWVFNKSGTPLYKLKFSYEDRPDPISDGKPGFDLQILKRITKIAITSSGKQFRHYTFQYEDQTGLTRLTKVTRYGRDGKTAYPVAFSMKYSEATYSKENSRLVTMPTALGVNFANRKADLLDINGDGLPDVIDTSKSNHVFHINTLTLDDKLKQSSHDFPTSATKTNAKATSGAELSNASVQMIDFNGDGFTDMVDAVNRAIYINKGNGQWESGSGNLDSFPVNGKDANMRFFDYNGDKAIDVISSNGSETVYWVSNGKGNWEEVKGAPNLGVSVSQAKIRFIDINGDGLNDAVQILKSSMRYKKYLGYGNWSDWITLKVPDIGKYDLDTKAQFNDMNGDGMADMVAFLGGSIVYFVNKNGKEFSAPTQIQSFFGAGIPDSTKNSVRIADMNGNGSRDIVWIDSNGKITYLELFSERPNLLKEITNNIGQRIQLSYGSSVYHYLRDKAANQSWRSKMPMAFTVINEIKTWASREAGNSNPDKACPSIQRIAYHDGFYDGMEKQFRGFRKVESVMAGDEAAGCLVKSIGERREMLRFYVGDGDTASGDNDLYYHGKMREKVTSGTSHEGKLVTFNSTKMEWKDCQVTGSQTDAKPDIRYICLAAQEQVLQEGEQDQSKWKTIRTEYTYDGYGNVILTSMLGEKDKEGDEKYFKNSYITPKDPNDTSETALWFLRLLTQQQVCTAPSGGECATKSFYYDGAAFEGLPSGQVTKGNVTRISAKPTKDAEPIHLARRKYDEYGNIIESKDGRGNISKVEWDQEYNRFPTKNTKQMDGYELSYSTVWDIPYAVVRTSTDWNGNTTSYQYDIFGRITAIYKPGDPDGKPSDSFAYKLQDPISTITRRRRSQLGGAQDKVNIQCFDGLGRNLQHRIKLGENKYLVAQHLIYNSSGAVARRTRMYQSSTDVCSHTLPEGVQTANTFFDGLGRVIRIVAEDGSFARRVYQPLKRTYYDAEDSNNDSPHYNTPTIEITDGLGRLLSRTQTLKGGKALVTSYEWSFLSTSGADRLVKVIDPKGNKKRQEFDLVGRLLKVIDPDRKTIQYQYDEVGNLISRRDERGVVTAYTFDSLNRLVSIQEKDKPETKIELHYDQPSPDFPEANNLKAKMSWISYPSGKEYSSYDRRGNLTHFRRVLLGKQWDFVNQYDNVDRLVTRTFPDGRKLDYKYDIADRLHSIPGVVENVTYNERGLIQSRTLANGVKTEFTFDLLQQPTKIDIQRGQILTSQYTYDTAGNVLTLKRGPQGQLETHNYTYDAIYRLTQATLGDKETLTYRYDDLGNLLEKRSNLAQKSPAHVGEYSYDPDRPHAATKAGKLSLSYDAAGYMQGDGQNEFTWDFLGRLKKAKTERGQVNYWYATARDRFLKESGGKHTWYVAKDYEIRDGASIIYVFSGTERIASWRHTKTTLYPDIAPLKEKVSQPDGAITVADAWLHHAARQGYIKMDKQTNTPDLDMSRDILMNRVLQLLTPENAKDSGSKRYYHHDHLGSTLAVTNSTGEVLSRTSYYPYGSIRSQTGSVFQYGYIGTEHEQTTGLNYANARYLNPKLGKWISADPYFDNIRGASDEWNSYWYAANNPIKLRDTAGTESKAGAIDGDAFAGAAMKTTASLGILLFAWIATKGQGNSLRRFSRGVAITGVVVNLVALSASVDTGDKGLDNFLADAGNYGTASFALVGVVTAAIGLYNKAKTKRDLNHKNQAITKAGEVQVGLASDLSQTKTTLKSTKSQLEIKSKDLITTQGSLITTQNSLITTQNSLRAQSSQNTELVSENRKLKRQNSTLKKSLTNVLKFSPRKIKRRHSK